MGKRLVLIVHSTLPVMVSATHGREKSILWTYSSREMIDEPYHRQGNY